MVDFGDAMQEWLKTVQNLADLTTDELTRITGAGAEVYKKELEEITRKKHYSSHKDEVYGHMADGISLIKTNIDGQKTGVSTVGWENSYHATNARRLNDGTIKYKADHFVTNTQQSPEVLKKVLLAEKEVYNEIIRKRG